MDSEKARRRRADSGRVVLALGEQLKRIPLAHGLAAVWLVTATAVFFATVVRHYPFQHWLFVRYVYVWGLAAVFALSCWVSGHAVLSRLQPVPAPVLERSVLGFGLGLWLFTTGVFVAGLLSLLNQVFFFCWPVALLLFGHRSWLRSARHARRRLAPLGIRLVLPQNLWQGLALLLLLLSCLALQLQVLTPNNLGADAHGYHFPIAEHYAAAGKIRAFGEGWYLGAYPQLSSIIYTWALLGPTPRSLDMLLAAQLEWVVFAVTLLGLVPLTGRLLRRRVPFAAAALFLFPGIYVYANNLSGTADHVLAFWTVPLALALFTLSRRFQAREAVVAGVMLAGALLTKHQGSFPALATALTLLLLTLRNRRIVPALVLGVTCLAASSPHWLKNFVFYGNPVYPFASAWFPTHPLHARAAEAFRLWGPVPVPNTRVDYKLLRALWRFSFAPWGDLKEAPIFGSLFTLLLPLLVLLRLHFRLWWLAFTLHACLILWWLTFPDPRFLQLMLPPMAALTAAVIAEAWRRGWTVRAPLSLLIALQVLWGADILFFREHGWIGDNPLKHFIDHVALGHQGKHEERDRTPGALAAFEKALPPASKLLVHDLLNGQLGAGHELVQDALGWQGAISYGLLDSPQATWQLWQKLGVTHTVWYSVREEMSLPHLRAEIAYRRAVLEYGKDLGSVAGRRYFSINDQPSDAARAAAPTIVAWLGCGATMPTGLYSLQGLLARKPTLNLTRSATPARANALKEANAAVARRRCAEASLLDLADGQFVHTDHAGDLELWVRQAQ